MTLPRPERVPLATYRLQFSAHLDLGRARQLVPYLDALGVTDAYVSPLFRAREQSSHGYDVVDHGMIHPEFGGTADFQAFAEDLRARGMGMLMDVVPNHMGIDDPANAWWQDVLENGPASRFARFFDIDWRPPKAQLRGKVLLPYLGDQFGRVLENRELRPAYQDHAFHLYYYDRRFPLGPKSTLLILRDALPSLQPRLDAENPDRMEFESIMTALENLPSRHEHDPERLQQRYREKEVIRRRLATLYDANPVVREAIDQTLIEYNGRKGEPRSFDRLEALLNEQAYRLCYWRVAADEINYRRFFDINALAAIRVEDPEVFEAVHAMIFRFLDAGWVTGLRIDHPDGLLDPRQYFANLQERFRALRAKKDQPATATTAAAEPAQIGAAVGTVEAAEGPPLYIAVEKILAHDETLPADWPVCGTTGYDFLNLLNGLFVDRRGATEIARGYRRFVEGHPPPADILYAGKRTVLSYSMSSELFVLAGELDRISEQHRWSRDFTRSALHRALREVIACFPVYRTYIRPDSDEVRPDDRRRVLEAIRAAKRRNPQTDASYFDFIGSVLLREDPQGLSDPDRAARRHFVLKFQQVTGPVMAKGLEDTAFYRYYPLASLNEVGGEPNLFGVTLDEFHRRSAERAKQWPYDMSATATHDTKRGEDTRARINALSEIPAEWREAVDRWHEATAAARGEMEGEPIPDRNEEYLFYQTLVGTWRFEPRDGDAWQGYVDRIAQYMEKALREAKVHTSWISPNSEHDALVDRFVRTALDPAQSGAFLDDVERLSSSIADAGYTNSLAQTLVKIGSPGVPDFYQGTELWSFSLVDPDNRRPVDFDLRERLLDDLRRRENDLPALAADTLAAWPKPQVKLHLIWRALNFRRQNAELFLSGSYMPLEVAGPRSENVLAFAREHQGQWAVVVVPRMTVEAWRAATGPQRIAQFAAWYGDTQVRLPAAGPWRHVLTGESLDGESVSVAAIFAQYPVGLMTNDQGPMTKAQ